MKKLLFSLAFGLFAFIGTPEAVQASTTTTISERVSVESAILAYSEANHLTEPDEMFYFDSGIPDGGGNNIMYVFARYGEDWVLVCIC